MLVQRIAGEMICVGHGEMDAIHEELLQLLDSAADCRNYDDLVPQLDRLIEHTRDHFDTEQQWMERSRFPLIREHLSEHRQLMGELEMMRRRLRPATLPLVRNFITERLPDWLNSHLQRMDSLLAAHLKQTDHG